MGKHLAQKTEHFTGKNRKKPMTEYQKHVNACLFYNDMSYQIFIDFICKFKNKLYFSNIIYTK
jgi:hypothetical protein